MLLLFFLFFFYLISKLKCMNLDQVSSTCICKKIRSYVQARIINKNSPTFPPHIYINYNNLCYLYLEGCLWVSEVSFIVFDSLISSVESITTFVAVPMCSFEFLLPLYYTNNGAVVTAS